ncbi:MAG TPA: hypothetical protein VGQ76_08935 [Thermoanaerobaculia bacterium]|jgi:hypothetical protein|nr:hypothetical protein [Thermoanaerobaculia bacterium]
MNFVLWLLMTILPTDPPKQPPIALDFDRVITLHVEYDETFFEQHGDGVEDVVREAIAMHNIEWRRYRREWFILGELTFRPSGSELDASYILANFLHRTVALPDAIHINIVGRQLEVYTSGTHAMAIGGLAYRGSDALLISAAPGVTAELLAYYLFHELGHCWDAYDIPFQGGDSTYGSKTRVTFVIDAGNEEIMEDSSGPLSRRTRGRAPMVIREKLLRARAATREIPVYPQLHDLLLHEPSPSNPAYVRKKREILEAAGDDAPKIVSVLQRYEITRRQLREDAEVRQQIAEHYWRANDAISNRDYDAADAELQAIRTIAVATPDVHLLVGAVERKVRKRR